MHPLRFTDVDLAANRRGDLTDAQAKALDERVEMLNRQSKWLAVILGGMLFIGGLIGVVNAPPQDASSIPSSLIGIGIMAVCAMVLYGAGFVWTQRSLTHSPIRTYAGRATVINSYMDTRFGRVPVYKVVLRRAWYARKAFTFPDEASLRHFTQGDFYSVYYLPYPIPYVLSAEQVKEKR